MQAAPVARCCAASKAVGGIQCLQLLTFPIFYFYPMVLQSY